MNEHLQDLKSGGRPMTKLELANKEIERLNKELEFQKIDLEEIRKELIGQDKYIDILKIEYAKEIERLHSIIKEAREYIGSYNLPKDLGHLGEAPISIRELRDILEILDKVEENK